MERRTILLVAIVATFLTCNLLVTLGASEDEPQDNWAPIRPLLGEWKGEGFGFGGRSSVQQTYQFILDNQFIHSRTRSEFEPKEGASISETHEDWGFFSFDPAREKIIFRQFLSEGYVNTYVLEEFSSESKRLVFTSEATEGASGMQARLIYSFMNQDEYELVLELAQPGKDFIKCQTLSMKRLINP